MRFGRRRGAAIDVDDAHRAVRALVFAEESAWSIDAILWRMEHDDVFMSAVVGTLAGIAYHVERDHVERILSAARQKEHT